MIETALAKIKIILEEQVNRVNKIKEASTWINYQTLDPLIIGVCPGDGIGPEICAQAEFVLKELLHEETKANRIQFKLIEGLTLENRVKNLTAIPTDVLDEIKSCHVILKGPTTTPQKGGAYPNIESANVAMRRELDLFANVRPIRIPELCIDWCFFRENTEDLYTLGSRGFAVNSDLSIDFRVISAPGTERIARLAFEYAKNNQKKRVTVVTKSNVVKATDGLFSEVAHNVAKEYEAFGITLDEWYIDIMMAKLLDPARR
ncbi:MAG: isocitrate/isopropylmalate family dehydrogenase, partial [Candidatus Margulisiibacteriota bacterium]